MSAIDRYADLLADRDRLKEENLKLDANIGQLIRDIEAMGEFEERQTKKIKLLETRDENGLKYQSKLAKQVDRLKADLEAQRQWFYLASQQRDAWKAIAGKLAKTGWDLKSAAWRKSIEQIMYGDSAVLREFNEALAEYEKELKS